MLTKITLYNEIKTSIYDYYKQMDEFTNMKILLMKKYNELNFN